MENLSGLLFYALHWACTLVLSDRTWHMVGGLNMLAEWIYIYPNCLGLEIAFSFFFLTFPEADVFDLYADNSSSFNFV